MLCACAEVLSSISFIFELVIVNHVEFSIYFRIFIPNRCRFRSSRWLITSTVSLRWESEGMARQSNTAQSIFCIPLVPRAGCKCSKYLKRERECQPNKRVKQNQSLDGLDRSTRSIFVSSTTFSHSDSGGTDGRMI